MEAQLVPEIDVLITVAKWLHSNGWQLEKISPTRGSEDERKIKVELTTVGISISNIKFQHVGEDIRARQGSNLWRIECKGLTGGKPETVKNNFDRAVASTVSYYTQESGLRLGLALTDGYNKFIRDKLPQALREAITLWVFLYLAKDEVLVFAPNEEVPLQNSE